MLLFKEHEIWILRYTLSRTRIQNPAEQPAENPAERRDENPAENPAEQPAENPAERPAENPPEQPAENPAEEPHRGPAVEVDYPIKSINKMAPTEERLQLEIQVQTELIKDTL